MTIPTPHKALIGLRFEPRSGIVIISGISAGNVGLTPLRWEPRHKAVLVLPKRVPFDATLDAEGLLSQIQLDLGQVISVRPRLVYPNRRWDRTRQNLQPQRSTNEVIVEFAAHPDAHFHLANRKRIPVSKLRRGGSTTGWSLRPVRTADQRVKIRVVERGTRKLVPVKLHIHGSDGEYLAPLDRHRIPNPAWFEDYSADLCHGDHQCMYISGETVIDLPLGNVYVEATKGFEIRPVRKVFKVTRATEAVTLELDKVLDWRERGWVTADTHVHFLSPGTAMLEGAAEGVNVINLLASQWGELMTNVGDFDGKTTFGSREAGGDGEYLVRVGTENRQHTLGHISLIGYEGNIIAPLCSDGADEAAIGNPVDMLLTQWAKRVTWKVASTIVPMTRVELILNGTIRESQAIAPDVDEGTWSIRLEYSAWCALLVRAKYADKPEMIAGHSSPVMVEVDGSALFAAAAALTILEQIEGSMAYIDTIGTRASAKRYKEMRMTLESAYRRLHNRMHAMGYNHRHGQGTDHREHHG